MVKKRILIIDDEVELARLTTKILLSAGYEVFCHERYEGALKKIRELKPDLILLDILLPDGSGLDLFEQLRLELQINRIPVAFFSATAKTESARLDALKPAAVIGKPYEIGGLLGTIKEVLSSSKS